MKYDVIVIGGGMSAIMCGIALATNGKNVALMVKGPSKLNYSSGSIDLLGFDEQGNVVDKPLDAIKSLSPEHPYSKMGIASVTHNAAMTPVILAGAGLKFANDTQLNSNHYRMTPLGIMRPTWLTLDNYVTSSSNTSLLWDRVALVNLQGFLDFPSPFVAKAITSMGVDCQVCDVKLGAIERLSNNQQVIRSTAVAKLMQNDGIVSEFARKVRSQARDVDAVIMPAVFGLDGDESASKIASQLKMPVKFVPTLPPSVTGTHLLSKLRKLFIKNGGTFLLGSMVKNGKMKGNRVLSIEAKNFPDQDIIADQFVLATGSFINGGLVSSNQGVKEPIFNLDIDYKGNLGEWSKENLFDAQPYMEFGVSTDAEFHAIKDGQVIENLYAIGSILSGHNSLKLADDTGVAITTALQVARQIGV